MKKLKVTAVSYLNTKPFLYGIFNTKLDQQLDIQLDIPSVCAKKLQTGIVDLGLIPVAAIPQLPEYHIISDYCIGTEGAVKTVAIFSDCPIQEVEQIYLDYHSRTSIELTKILLEKYWKIQPELLNSEAGFKSKIHGKTAALVIGDKAINLEKKHPFCYDLGTAWYDYTGLPFVFAAWVSTRQLPEKFLQQFNNALRKGLELIPQLTYILPKPHPEFDLETYFTQHISYDLDASKQKALSLFLEAISPTSNRQTFGYRAVS